MGLGCQAVSPISPNAALAQLPHSRHFPFVFTMTPLRHAVFVPHGSPMMALNPSAAGAALHALAVVSGSCSPMSAAQIDWAEQHGFLGLRLAVPLCLNPLHLETEIEGLVQHAAQAVARGVSPVIYSAKGPDDPAVLGFEGEAQRAGLDKAQASERVGLALAEVMRRLLDRTALRRIVVAGGDSAGAVASHLGVQAFAVAAGMAPGVPLYRAWSDQARRDGLEIALKGGQLGLASFYGDVRAGRVAADAP